MPEIHAYASQVAYNRNVYLWIEALTIVCLLGCLCLLGMALS